MSVIAAGEANTLDTLNGLFKEVYADTVIDLLPAGLKVQKMIPFVPKAKEQGGKYKQPVTLAHEHGVTYAGATASDTEAFNLAQAVAGKVEFATADASEMVLRSRLSYKAASRAAQGRNAFVDATEMTVRNMRSSIAKRLEIALLHGGRGIGVVASADANSVTLTAGSWASGIWAGMEGALIQAHDPSDGTVQNAGVTIYGLDGTTTSTAMKVKGVDPSTYKITVTTGHATGVAADDVIYFAGSNSNEIMGLAAIQANEAELFGIDATKWSMWAGNVFSVGAALSFDKVGAAVDLAVARGLEEDVTLLINSESFTDLLSDAASKRMYDSSYSTSKLETGANELRFYSQNGQIKIVPSIYVKRSEAHLLCVADWLRIGSTDVTFNRPGQTDSFFLDLQENAGYELRAYTDQAVFCEAPARQVLLTGITPGV